MSADWDALFTTFEGHGSNGKDAPAPEEPSAEEREPWPEETIKKAMEEGERIADDQEQEKLDRIELLRERARRKARRAADAEELADGSGEAVVETFQEGAHRDVGEQEWVVRDLLIKGGRVMFAAYRKAGKTSTVLNLLRSWGNGVPFLNHFDVEPLKADETAVWLNLELDHDQADRWLARLQAREEWGARLVAVHMRGRVSNYSLTRPDGVAALVALLRRLGATRVVVDPIAPLAAVSGLDPSKDIDVGVFLAMFDRIAIQAGVREIVYVHHVAANVEDGAERAKGSTRWEDAADAIWLLGKEKESGRRWFKAEGRDVDIAEVTVLMDPADEITLSLAGGSRRDSLINELMRQVCIIVEEIPGVARTELIGDPRLGGKTDNRKAAVRKAVSEGYVEVVPDGATKRHFRTAKAL